MKHHRIAFLACLGLLLLPLGASSQQKQHNVELYWQQAVCPTGSTTCAQTSQFNIYRSTSATGPWNVASLIGNTQYTASLASCTAESGLSGQCWTFVDVSGTGGTKYFYAVTAADAAGYESAAAVTASAVTFPVSANNPSVPVGVVH